jgi:hypothetical protein
MFTDGIKIIDNNYDSKRITFKNTQCGYCEYVKITKEQIQALLNDKCLAFNAGNDCVFFFMLDKSQ